MAEAEGDIQFSLIKDEHGSTFSAATGTGPVVDGSDRENVGDGIAASVGVIFNGDIAVHVDGVLGVDSDDGGGNVGDGIAASADGVVGGDDDDDGDGSNDEAAADGGHHGRRRLHQLALEVILGNNNLERIGLFIGLVGLATMSSGIGGFFARGIPAFFNDYYINEWEARYTFYKCLPSFIVLGLAEMMYAVWVSRNAARSSTRIAKLVLFASIPPLVLSWSFTGSPII
ncbi:hypothetical protein OsI_31944 [Oryza sativa Indica Group]|uniref:Uncharacterized protein n=1 Tax=Oryza sativa subsp. indica TaxID=39946 RepID=A2Z2U9_ORYSI|nr:hypothetical protein OsI_31944 [Oryza sativa Indica Group]